MTHASTGTGVVSPAIERAPSGATGPDAPWSAPQAGCHCAEVIARLTVATENLANAVAALRRGEAHGVTTTATLLDADDLATLLGADVRTVRRWVREGEVPPPLRIGGTLRWRRADVERWLEAKR